ncbi:DHA2 family efflux MFS transporter permease subunit [Nocardiopsis sp. NPDC057823]|uniref:DHA2 family efflux MFS transporter permease subunit n=1 Tax=Nocardiopsis sp. NPDC057823 TaxID=3346256 RepID=UPI00366D1D34
MSEKVPRTRGRERLDAPLVRLTAVLLAGAFAALADSTVVTVAVDDLSDAFDAPVSRVQWVVTANLLAMTAAIPVVGWALDRFGPRAAWIGALTLFGAGAALSCAAWSLESLIVMRALTGFGGGMVLPLTMAILARAAGPGRVGRAMALISVPGQLAPVLGPVAGGAVLESLGHRWVFALVLPLVAVAVLSAVRGIPRGGPDRSERLDPLGLALLSLGLVALLHGLSSPTTWAGPLWAGLGALLLSGFALSALRPREGAPPPALDLRLFAHSPFRNGAALMFVFGLCIWGGMFLLPLFHQRVSGADPLDAGLLLAPMGAGVALAVLCVGGPADRLAPRHLVVAGLAVAALATVPFALATADTPQWWLGAALFVRGAGLGTASVPLLAAAYRGLEADRIPHATVALNVLQRVGAAAGTAGLALVLTGGAASADPVPAFQAAFWWMAALTAAALLPALLLPATRPDRDA